LVVAPGAGRLVDALSLGLHELRARKRRGEVADREQVDVVLARISDCPRAVAVEQRGRPLRVEAAEAVVDRVVEVLDRADLHVVGRIADEARCEREARWPKYGCPRSRSGCC
jgi:hypothetical protein